MSAARITALFFFLLASSSFAGELMIVVRPAAVAQGEIAELRVSGSDIAGVKASVDEREIAVFPVEEGSYAALFGVDLEKKPGAVQINVQGWSRSGAKWEKPAELRIVKKAFPLEKLSVPESFDRIDEATKKRIDKEQAMLDRLWRTVSPGRLWKGAFVAPVSGAINSPFGLRRVINGLPRIPHGGVDLKAAMGTEILAANQGRVVLRDELFFSGKSLVLDHGGGLYTMYFHLSEFRVEKGAEVLKGEVIGQAGMTGRVTGPHLHWGARLNGARVDPFALVGATRNEIEFKGSRAKELKGVKMEGPENP